jgi:P27 family predicted phage terminase small subunit
MLTGPLPKPKEKRQRRNKTNVVPMRSLMLDAPVTIPEAPEGLSEKNVKFWRDYWSSELARAADPQTDLQAITRLFTLYDERDKLDVAYRKAPLMKGSMGQPVVNPVRAVISACDADIIKLEDRFGLSPISRLRLGITIGEAAQSMAALNKSLMQSLNGNEEETTIDPREVDA